uniref:MYB family transcription factor n=1 Tax=Melilotus albus TaxID=47082 RepID=A0A896W4P8_MELAB|nr:MYB family transcription factor [Melilotus albus]
MKNYISKRSGVRKYHKSEQPRLRWTPELHQYFVQTVESLGGKHKASPKHILNMMQVKGLRISHIKSHLQMYRNVKGQTILAPLEENAQLNHLPICSSCSPQRSRNINQELQPLHNKGLSKASETDYYDLNQEPESSACNLSDMSNEEGNYINGKYLNLPFSFSSLLIPVVHNDQGRTLFSSPNTTDNHVLESSSIKSHGRDYINLDLSI